MCPSLFFPFSHTCLFSTWLTSILNMNYISYRLLVWITNNNYKLNYILKHLFINYWHDVNFVSSWRYSFHSRNYWSSNLLIPPILKSVMDPAISTFIILIIFSSNDLGLGEGRELFWKMKVWQKTAENIRNCRDIRLIKY